MSTAPRLAAAKRDWGNDETDCTVLHIDMDAFYASCETARHPELKGKPLIIGTGTRSVVSAASYEARKFGINSAMSVAKARRLCPNGIFLPVDMHYYRRISKQIFTQVFTQITDQIEQVSVDECYMNVTGALLKWQQPTNIAQWIRQAVCDNFKVTCSVGIASNKLVAKIASTNAKPDGLLLIPVDKQAHFVQLMPLRSIPGIGPSLEKRLNAWGIDTVARLSQYSEAELFKATGSKISSHRLFLASHGLDESQVQPHSTEKSIGAERTFLHDTTSLQKVSSLLRHCSDEVATSLRKHELLARTITVKLRFEDLHYTTKSHTLQVPVNSATDIYPQAMHLLQSILGLDETSTNEDTLPNKIRLVGVSASGLSKAKDTSIQPSLEDIIEEENPHPQQNQRIQLAHAEHTLDAIRNRYGNNSVKLGL